MGGTQHKILSRCVRNFVRGRGLLSDLATRICGKRFSVGGGPELASELSWNCGEEGATKQISCSSDKAEANPELLVYTVHFAWSPCAQHGEMNVESLQKDRRCWNHGSPLTGTCWRQLSVHRSRQFISFMTSTLVPDSWRWEIKAETEVETTALLPVEPTEPKNNDLFIGFNASDQPENVILPSLPDGREWRRLVDTALPFPGFFSVEGETVVAEEEEEMLQPVMYEMKPYSCTLFETINATTA
ncbi:hypothetical protein Rs2_00321 [Raphanus sativus]|nr:hypothetical protein Rs2_00321 [Raphanus sativus]